MVFTNKVALEDETLQESSGFVKVEYHQSDEPEIIEIHKLPPKSEDSKTVTKEHEEMPLLSAVTDYEEGKKADESK